MVVLVAEGYYAMKIYRIQVIGPDGEEGDWYTAQQENETFEDVIERIHTKVEQDGDDNLFANGPAVLNYYVTEIDTEKSQDGILKDSSAGHFEITVCEDDD